MSDNTNLKIGQKFGIWTIIEDTGKLTRWREKIYKALSDYGKERVVWRSHIEYGGPGYPVNVLNNQTNLERKRVKKKIHKRKVPISTTAITKEKLEVPTLTTSKWSIKYNKCVKCGGTEYPHKGRGLCQRCYENESRKRHENHIQRDGRRSAYSRKGIVERLTEEVLKKEYIAMGKSLTDIAREYNCTRQYILKLLNKYGIPRRTKSEARKIAIERKKLKFEKEVDGQLEIVYLGGWTINRDFFKTWTPQMAYVLGFIYADGTLDEGRRRNPKAKTTTTSPRCIISQKYPEILEKIKALMSCNKKLYKTKNRPRGYIYRLDLNDEEIYKDLLNIGLTPAKSNIVKFPEMPPECIRHFIRGCWDGDGSVYLEKRKDLDSKASASLGKKVEYIKDIRLGVSFVSGSKEFIERIVLELYKVGIGRDRLIEPAFIKPREYLIKGLTIHRYPYKQARYIKIGGKKKCEILFHYFYDEVDESQYLKRKYEVFRKGLDLLKDKRAPFSK